MHTCIDVNNWSTETHSFKPWDCACKRSSGSKRAGHKAPGAVGCAHCGIIGSFNAKSVYNTFKYLLNRAYKKSKKKIGTHTHTHVVSYKNKIHPCLEEEKEYKTESKES